MIDISHSEEIYTVSRLNREARFLLESNFPSLWLEGEISGFKAHTSGHWYFCIKDQSSQIRCAMFRTENRRLHFKPQDGMHVLLKVSVSLYENRGDYQLIVDQMEEVGEGQLRREFEALKNRLSAKGLFDAAYKKKLPHLPQRIGLITSPTGAAVRDILSVFKRRYPFGTVIIYPTLVQGASAAPQIIEAIKKANQRNECDILILTRGGGSLEDLWCFNDEALAHAIFESELPVVSGVGHEIDFTIADFVADLRAATPTAAAELVTPDLDILFEKLTTFEKHFIRLINQKLLHLHQDILLSQKHLELQHPKQKMREQIQRLDNYEITLNHLMNQKVKDLKNKFLMYGAQLNALSPLGTLQRGFSIATQLKDSTILRNAAEVALGDKIEVQLQKGKLQCTVDHKN